MSNYKIIINSFMVAAHDLTNHGTQLPVNFCAVFIPTGQITHKLVYSLLYGLQRSLMAQQLATSLQDQDH